MTPDEREQSIETAQRGPRPEGRDRLKTRIVRAAEAALARQHYVTAIDILVGIGWLPPSRLADWRQGRCESLERVIQVNLHQLSDAMTLFRQWARTTGLLPRETAYVSQTRDRHPLRFSVSGDPRSSRLCARCSGSGSLLFLEDSDPLCLHCASLDHLVFLPAGDALLTRRTQRASSLSAVVVRFSRSRKRYERQGLLVEESALEQARREVQEQRANPAAKTEHSHG